MSREELERIAEALERIALVLEGFESGPAERCAHEKREDFSVMGSERWRCLECGHEVGLQGLQV